MRTRPIVAIATAACTLLGLLALAPVAAAATPHGPWTGTGSTTTNVVAGGLSGPAIFAYDNLAPGTGGGGANGTWEFTAANPNATAETVDLDWVYQGFHAFFQVNVGLEAFVNDAGLVTTTPLIAVGPTNCCSEPSGGFSYSGTVSLAVPAGSTYGFRMSGSNGDSNSRLRGRLLVDAAGADLQEDVVVVNGYDAAKTSTEWGITESYLSETRDMLTDPANFGAGGTVGTQIVIADGVGTASATSLLGTDIFFVGYVPNTAYAAGEKDALRSYVEGGGKLIATTDNTNFTMVDVFGLTQGNSSDGANPSTFASADHPIADGPFGTQTQFDQYSSVGEYPDVGPDALVVASNSDAVPTPTMAEILPGTLTPRSGLALFVADVDFFSDTSAGGGFTGSTDNAVAIKNLFAYLIGPDRPAEPGVAQVLQAIPAGAESNGEVTTNFTYVVALAQGPADETQRLEVVYSTECVDGVLAAPTTLGEVDITFVASEVGGTVGQAVVSGLIESVTPLPTGAFVSARLVIDDGEVATTGALSACILSGPDNDSWVRALEVDAQSAPADVAGVVTAPGNARWFKFDVVPGAKVDVELTGLPADYDLALFKDIRQTFTQLENTVDDVDDLNQLSAEFAPSAFAPSAFAPSAFAPSAFAPSAFAPSAFAPSAFAPSAFAPSAFAPSAFAPSAFAPSAFAPSAFAPSAFAPSAFAPSAFAPSAFAPSAFAGENFASAQTLSLLAVSAQPGTGGEAVVADTWNNTGEFYVRVTGKNGAFDPDDDFDLSIAVDGQQCANVAPVAGAAFMAPSDGYETLILTDNARIDPALPGNDATALADLDAKLSAYAGRDEVNGVIVDLGQFAHIGALHTQADANASCPYAENLTADAIKDVIDAYRLANPTLRYITIVGSDTQVPFYRYPDQALLGPEQDYDPPVADGTQSQSALRLNYVLGQDEYGATRTLSLKDAAFPVPDMAVGRLVETATEMTTVLDAYLATADGIVTPESSLVTGYDFLTDAANAVQDELVAGTTSGINDTLITPANLSPQDPASWTADQLRTELLDEGDDVVFLAGHFSANSALAADFETELLATELAASDADLTNSIVFSNGCHSGYNIANDDVVAGVTEPVDWTQAFAQKGATLIAGTGYQYGDTDFIEYSERIYVEFAKELRRGPAGTAVAVGDALVRAKQEYLATTPKLEGLHRKSVLISTVFGLPNLRVLMPGERLPVEPSVSDIVPDLVGADPGNELGLRTAAVSFDLSGPALVEETVTLTDVETGATLDAKYLRGPNGVLTNIGEPALPRVAKNVTVSDAALRGVGFRGGAWTETTIDAPLTGAPATEIRGVHTPFSSLVNFPMKLTNVNYFGALTGSGGTRLEITPAQHRVDAIGDTSTIRRQFSSMDLELFYSANTATYDQNQPALAAPPTISGVQARVVGDDIEFRARVVGDLSAGIQEVWITHTDGSGATSGTWVALDLVQDATDSTLWTATLPGAATGVVDYVVHAVNGVGLVTTDDNYGAYYSISGVPEAPPAEPIVTALTLSAPTTATFGTTVAVAATLTADGLPVDDASVLFTQGASVRSARTDANGVASLQIPVTSTPGSYTLTASYAGVGNLPAASASSALDITPAPTVLTVASVPPTRVPGGVATGISADLRTSSGNPLLARTVYFTLVDQQATQRTVARITDNVGTARLGTLDLPAGTYTITARFLGSVPTSGGTAIQVSDPAFVPSTAGTSLVANNAPDTTAEDVTVAEGSTAPVTATATDDDGDTLTYSWTGGDAAIATLDPATDLTPTITGVDEGETTFTLVSNDGFDDSEPTDITVTVTNVAPTIDTFTVPGGLVELGDSATVTIESSDPGVDDVLTTTIDWGDGTDPEDVTGTTASHIYAASGTYTVTVTVEDDAAAPAQSTTTATIQVNDTPVATPGAPIVIDEGSSVETGASATDADPGEPVSFTWTGGNDAVATLDDTTIENPTVTGVDDGDTTFTLVANDGKVDSNEATTTVTVRNVAPVINTFNAPTTPVAFDQLATIELDVSDVGTNDTLTTTIDWGADGDTIIDSGATLTDTASKQYAAPGDYIITVTVTDDDGGTVTDTRTVTINAPPEVSADDLTVDEGSTAPVTATATDPDGDNGLLTYTWTGGDADIATLDPATTLAPTITGVDDVGDGTTTFTLTANDGLDDSEPTTITVTVTNVAPVLDPLVTPLDPTPIGQSIELGISAADVGTRDTLTTTIDWGDGTADGTIDTQTNSINETATHPYAEPGVYTITVTVTDDDGGSVTATSGYVVIYDPTAGFVTGGGHIWSPMGALVADPLAQGKATFGFVSKYKKGANRPDGNTTFKFKAGDLEFNSTSYDWLVVSSDKKAQYQGTGTINGGGNYDFTLTAIDDDDELGDRFRIRIWNRDGGGLVYDTNPLADEYGDESVPLEGGSIKIHRPKGGPR